MSTIINARSPYYLKYVPVGFPYSPAITSVDADIYIYAGVKGTNKPPTPQYTINKAPTEQIQDGDNNFVVLEISSLIRDYIYTNYYDVAVDAVWVEVDATTNYNGESPTVRNDDFLAFDGFGLFQEGVNPRESTDPTEDSFTPQLLQDNVTMYFVEGQDIRIPIFSEPESTIVTTITGQVWNLVDEFWEVSNITWDGTEVTQNVTDSDDTADKIQYVIISSTGMDDGDTITITSTVGNPQTTVITLRKLCDPKYTPLRVIFYNKYGALQDFYVNKKNEISLRSSDESYNVSIMDFSNVSYNVNKHTTRRFNVEGKQSIITNTDFVVEALNEPIKQMLLSESVWIEDNGEVTPVIVKDSNFKEKTHLNDKLIQYTFNFEYAFEHIQNVR